MKRPPTEPWVYRSLTGGVYDCRTKEEGRLEIVKADPGKLDKLLAAEQQKSYKLSFELAHVRDQKDQAIALLRDAYERMPDLPAGVTHHVQCDHTKCKIRRYLEGGDEGEVSGER